MNGCQDNTRALNHPYDSASVHDVFPGSSHPIPAMSYVLVPMFSPKTAFFTSVQVVHFDYFLVVK